MYAMSQADQSKFKKAAVSIKNAFSSGGPAGMIDLGGNSGGPTANPFEIVPLPAGRLNNLPAGKTNTASDPDPDLQEVKELLEETISLDLGSTDVSDRLQMQFDSRGLVVRIAAKDFFADGQVEVRPDLRPILDRVGKVLSKTKRLIRLEGHSDLNEAQVKGFPSDWELSAARAAWIARYWMGRFDFEPSRLGVAGYSHFRPLTFDTEGWNRAKNRRVEIIILNNTYVN